MITTKKINISEADLFLILFIRYLKRFGWLLIVLGVLAIFAIINKNIITTDYLVIFLFVFHPLYNLFQNWRFVQSKENKYIFQEGYFEIDENKTKYTFDKDNFSSMSNESFIKVELIKEIYLIYIGKNQFFCIPISCFESENDRIWFEKEIIETIRKRPKKRTKNKWTAKKRIIVFSIIAVAVISFGLVVKSLLKNSYRFELNNPERYYWLFKDSVRKNISKLWVTGSSRKNEIKYTYIYKKQYHIIIWEFEEQVLIENVTFNSNVNLSKVVVHPLSFHETVPRTKVLTDVNFNKRIIINTDENSTIINNIDSLNYKGFFGRINKMTLNNEEKPLILFEYEEPLLSLFLVYKHEKSIILINVCSKKDIDNSIINIFNLD